ncbi:MAG TPA: DUF5655 domain-containing protein [Thermoanaerobaculia bacterium]|nr:DUF5655 domain-containing protein [Thermoanaerobaculia bacterium]
MSTPEQALETQLKNIQAKTGKSFDELAALVKKSGLHKHGEIRDMLKRDLGLGYGDANTLAHFVLKIDNASAAQEQGAGQADVLDELYSGPKAALRPIHDKLMAGISEWGAYEIAPKKGYLSLRRKKQFAMIGPATNSRVEVGLNMKGVEPTDRLAAVPPGGMCNYKVKVTDATHVDDELFAWIRQAYDSAG